eukprot:scaffold14066_cov40-Cyclotella_meneghiniana.AAC.5
MKACVSLLSPRFAMRNALIAAKAASVGMFLYIDSASAVKMRAVDGNLRARSRSFKANESLK